MKKLTFLLICAFLGLAISCQKTKDDPCTQNRVISEPPPVRIGVVFIDKESGKNLIILNNLDNNDVKVTADLTGAPHESWFILNEQNVPENLKGTVVFLAWPASKVGDHIFTIQVGDFGSVKLSYTINRVETDNPCSSYYYKVEDAKIIDHPFEYLENDQNLLQVIL